MNVGEDHSRENRHPRSKGCHFQACEDSYQDHAQARGLVFRTIESFQKMWIRFSSWAKLCGYSCPSQIPLPVFYTWLDSLNLSPTSRSTYVLRIRYAFCLAVEDGKVPAGPLLRAIPPKFTRTHRDVLSIEEINSVKSYIYSGGRWRREKSKCRVLFWLAMLGLRLSSITELKMKDIHGDHFSVRVKGGALRDFPIGDDLRAAISDWLLYRNSTDQELIGTNRNNIARSFRRMLKFSGVERNGYLGPHLWRHSVATQLYKQVKDYETVRQYLGHVSIATTMGYVHLDHEDMMPSFEILKGVIK